MNSSQKLLGVQKPSLFRTHSFKIFISFVIFSTLVTAIYGFFIFRQIKDFELDMMRFQVQTRMDWVLKNETELNVFFPGDEFLDIYETYEALPEYLSKLLAELPEGLYLTYGPGGLGGDRDYHIAIKTNPKTGKLNYYIFDEERFEGIFHRRERLKKAFLRGWGIAVFLSIVIGFVNARRLISPGRRLVDKLLRSDPNNLPVDFAKEFGKDELGSLAKALETSMQRIKAFIEREKQLTRDASHELRTPVTVIKGAVELLQQIPELKNSRAKRPLDRIERSVGDMEVLIEVMLIRAREEASLSLENTKNCNLSAVAGKVIEESRYIVEGRPVELIFEAQESPEIRVSEPELKMVLSNIVRNAINYTQSGIVKVVVNNDFIDISDTGPGIDTGILDTITEPYVKGTASKGYGIGLSIVNRICSKYGWKLDIASNGEGTTFRIEFGS